MYKKDDLNLKTKDELIEEIEYLRDLINEKDLVISILKLTSEILNKEE